MKYLPLVWAMLWRSKARTWLTFLSIVVAFLLYGALQAVSATFMLGVRLSGDDRLIVTYRQGLTKLLPAAYQSRIEAVDPDIIVAAPVMFLPATWKDPKNQIQVLATDPETLVPVDPRIVVDPAQLQAFKSRRMAVLAGRALAEQHGWKVGDRLPLQSPVQRKDGTEVWEFDLVGTFELDRARTGVEVPAQLVVMHLDAYNEGATFSNYVIWYTVRVRDPARATAIGKAIDASFRNSELETRTQSEADFQRGFVKQFGNVGKMMGAILAAVFFTLVLVAGNAMMQAFRERVPELAVLKTLGFGNGRVAALIAAESLLLCALGGAVGLGLARALVPLAPAGLTGPGSTLFLEPATLATGFALALGLGAVAALVPAWRSARLSVVEGLVRA